ncbi:hypothetical protein BDP27DRAFT_1331798 [Rhodocollybia butyracea]|uniref:Putative gamma-glutamylcyclotransferase n=1 Tax=Rhodocollybia butyracea TaxID=206335 RepID=A0A9P5PN86_9AGAR|nr:hypothetical protein BDP27DRAFT_1331798 [Rhodocollybia butyracea]
MADLTFSSFFYGTLMHPKILKRVIDNDASHLQIAPAVLLEHTRHKVRYADYPGLVPWPKAQSLFDRELTQDERCVRGTLVTGLTKKDMVRLDNFEGDEYSRRNISVHPLQPLIDIIGYNIASDDSSLVPASPPPLPPLTELLPAVAAQTYIYNDVNDLEAELWSFDDFIKNNAWKWYSKDNPDIAEVDRRAALGTTSIVVEEVVA